MKVGRIVGLLVVLAIAGAGSWYFWKQAEPRRHAFQTLQQFDDALATQFGA